MRLKDTFITHDNDGEQILLMNSHTDYILIYG